MTGPELAAALRELRLPKTAALTRRLLCRSGRQIQRYCAGARVPREVAVIVHLLRALDGVGVPPAAADPGRPPATDPQYVAPKF